MTSAETLQQILGPGGAVARSHPQYEYRPGQIRMAQAVAEALGEGHHLCVEAGTGTGKTLAYLLPCLSAQKRVIISTGTKNLQEQLFFKDIPFLERALGSKLSVCYLKGRNNYLCLTKLDGIDSEPYLFSPHDPKYLVRIREWVKETETGDYAELRDLPEELPLLQHLSARRDTCTGQKCRDYQRCFVTRVRQRALESDIVIVNHHLFFADLSLRQGDFATVLPDYSAVIFDEAHELEDIASQYFGTMVSNYRIEELVRDTGKALAAAGSSAPSYLAERMDKLARRSSELFSQFRGSEGRRPLLELGSGLRVRRGPMTSDTIGDSYAALTSELVKVGAGLAAITTRNDEMDALVRRCSEIQADLSEVLESDTPDHVFWFESRGRGIFLWATPIQVAQILQDRLFSKVDSVVLTSATLSTGGNFQFIRSRLGLDGGRELILGSHFDYSRQAIFYVPRDIPEPREYGWAERACEELERILDASQGRAFVLFTSYHQMELVHNSLAGRLPFPMLLQGRKGKTGLLEEFRRTPNAVLFGTSSFWQGVDVQGEQLSCVVIDKLPFSVPNDPVVAARIRHLNESGGNAFYEYQIPEAIILLKQGFGRLIRSRTDRGILALLDKRVVTKTYGSAFVRSLPPVPLIHDPGQLRKFFVAAKPAAQTDIIELEG
jgi:ATP-dependent DNA helicase DinG